MNVYTASVLSFVYFLFSASIAAASNGSSRIVLGITQLVAVTGAMGFLALPAILTLAVLLERVYALYGQRQRKGTDALFDRMNAMVEADALGEAMALLGRRQQHVTASIYRAAIARAHQPIAVIERGVKLAEVQALGEIAYRRELTLVVTLIWGWAALLLAAFNASELAVGSALMFVASVATATVVAVRRQRLSQDVATAAVRIVDALEYRFLEDNEVEEAPKLQARPSTVVAAALPAYEEMLEMPSEKSSAVSR